MATGEELEADVYPQREGPSRTAIGIEYPVVTENRIAKKESANVLFICSKNQWRSPTAEQIYRQRPLINARSAGTARSAKRQITSADLQWADVILVMEDKHKKRLMSDFPGEMRYKEIHVLGIPDDYRYMDPELIEVLTTSIDPILFPSRGPQGRPEESPGVKPRGKPMICIASPAGAAELHLTDCLVPEPTRSAAPVGAWGKQRRVPGVSPRAFFGALLRSSPHDDCVLSKPRFR